MATITEHTPGMFSWADLATTDPEAAKRFYTTLFGWSYDDQPAGPNSVYSMAKIGEQTAAALYRQQEDELQVGIPPHWTCYFTVSDIEAKAAAIAEFGGNVLVAPFDVFDAGRMCVLADPVGAMCALWQPKRSIGATTMGDHGTLVWAELSTRDVDKAGRFHASLHGFETDSMPTPAGKYTVFKVGDNPSCGMVAMPKQVPAQTPSYWMPYFAVTDCDATLEQGESMGGRTLTQPTEIEGIGRFATLADPQGAVFAVIRSAPMG